MINNIEFEKGLLGTKAIIKGLWHDSYIKLFSEREVKELELNDGKGWRGENIDFLTFLPYLKSLILIDFGVKSIEAIHTLKGLLKLEILTYSKTPINFNAFPNLLQCGFEWIKGSDSLFEISSLQKLFINSYDKKDSAVFSNLFNLKELSILNSKIENLQGLTSLKNLRILRLGNLKKVTSLQGLQNLVELEELEIQRCKGISNISELLKLNKLKHLLLSDLGDITSIKGIECLTELKDFLFYESTNITDGDLSPITKLKSLNKISYQNRKHYSHRREDFGKLYA
jgi:hypothetical protein